MSDLDEGFVFDGSAGLSCEAFVRLVRQFAFSKDRGKDDDWIAQFAATRMDGIALRWLEDQEDEVQDSWKRLRRAMLINWPVSAAPAASSAPSRASPAAISNVPTPAAAPPPSQSTPSVSSPAPYSSVPASAGAARQGDTLRLTNAPMRGRLKVLSKIYGSPLGHIGRTYSKDGHHITTFDIADALRVEIIPSRDFHSIRILNANQSLGPAFLGAAWGTTAFATYDQISASLKAAWPALPQCSTPTRHPHLGISPTLAKDPPLTISGAFTPTAQLLQVTR